MKQFHILYKKPEEKFATGKNYEATDAIAALEMFNDEHDINEVIAIYRVGETGNIEY